MMKLGDTRKRFILLFCLILVLPYHAGFLTPVVLGEEKDQGEDEGEILSTQENKDVTITILEPLNGSSFNVSEILLGIETEREELEYSITISKGEKVESVIKVEDGSRQVPIPLSSYDEGAYTFQVTMGVGSEEQLSNLLQFEIDRTPPELHMIKPTEKFTNEATIIGTTAPEGFISVSLKINNHTLTTVSDQDGQFSFDLRGIVTPKVEYTITISAQDAAGNKVEKTTVFQLDLTRPFIQPTLFPKPKMTQVPINTVISAIIIDDNPLIAENVHEAILVYEQGSNTPITGTITFDEGSKLIVFTPDEILKPSQKYFVLINHLLTDQAGNLVHSRNWSFTTKADTDLDKNPHGNYQMNSNTCKTCHSVHFATKERLEEPNDELKEKLTVLEELEIPINSYCMACHDGTVASNVPNMNGHSNHNTTTLRADGSVQTQSCGSCHDVHLGWHETNANLLKDHFVFDHSLSTTPEGKAVGLKDSSIELCESCHDNDSLDRKLDPRVKHEVFKNYNWNTSKTDLRQNQTYFGKQEDYSLCIRCHNNEVKQNNPGVVDVGKFYSNTNTGSAHFISRFRINDGSLLDGHMPCSDCHETHGSNNVGLLKESLGHNNTQPYEKTEMGWNPSEVRRFCTSCHNGITEMYGNVIGYTSGEGDEEHPHSSSDSCLSCHSISPNTPFFDAVHNPRK